MTNTCALFNADSFFKLPIVSCLDMNLGFVVSRYQPMGFFDGEGNCWYAVLDDSDEVGRQRLT